MKKFTSILCAILVLSTFTFFALGSSDDKSEVKSGDDAAVENSDGVKESNELTANVGDTLTTNTLKIAYVSCEDFTEYSEYRAPKDGNKYVRLEFAVENTGSSDASISVYDFKCYADDVAVEKHYEDDDLSASLSSGRKATGAVYFEVPADAEKIEVEYETSIWSGKKAIFVVK